jgi:hypothetical protein
VLLRRHHDADDAETNFRVSHATVQKSPARSTGGSDFSYGGVRTRAFCGQAGVFATRSDAPGPVLLMARRFTNDVDILADFTPQKLHARHSGYSSRLRGTLDRGYLEQNAATLGVSDLLVKYPRQVYERPALITPAMRPTEPGAPTGAPSTAIGLGSACIPATR